MDLLGDIVEKETVEIQEAPAAPSSGFPELYQPEKISSWKVRLQEKKRQGRKHKKQQASDPEPRAEQAAGAPDSTMSEAERIHLENIKLMMEMSPEQLEREKQELLDSLDAGVIQGLLKRIGKKQKNESLESSMSSATTPLFAEIEGAPGTWVGGSREFPDLPRLDDDAVDKALGIVKNPAEEAKHVKFIEDQAPEPLEQPVECPPSAIEDQDDIAPQEYQFVQRMDHMSNEELLQDVHFIKNSSADALEGQFEALDLDDPKFDEKLHEKYFPDLPREVEKMQWMKPVPENRTDGVLDDVSLCRFDFKGNLVPPTRKVDSTYTGLHHHSEDPQLAGYTILELQHLSRSTFAAQRCIALQTLGRVLYKLGKQSYYQLVPEVDAETYKEEGGTDAIVNRIYAMFWDLCKACMVIESLEEAADEKRTRNISVRNYAIDALWLWKQGGGDFRNKQTTAT